MFLWSQPRSLSQFWVKKDYSDASQKLQGHFTQCKNITCCLMVHVVISVQSVVGDNEQRERKLYRIVSVIRQTEEMQSTQPRSSGVVCSDTRRK